jgi:integrase
MLGLKWNAPYYKNDESLPFVPTEKEVDALISGCTKKISTTLLLLKETGMRIGEAWKLKWTDLDDEQGTIRCKAEKHGKPRQFKISPLLISMLQKLPKNNEYLFSNSNLGSHRWRYDRQKTRLAEKLQNPRPKQIHFHTLRHFFATKLFDQTKSLPLVQEKLGHRNINSTMVYTHLVEFDEDSQNYYHSVARDEKEAGDLIDKGFQYVCTTPQGIMMFRKRK